MAPTDRSEKLCMAPWTHTYLSPQTERRMCCASREPAQNFQQYIDTSTGTGEYKPVTLEEHWNSEHMRSVRRRMMAGETLPECEVCNNKLLNTDVYRDYFNRLFAHKYQDIWTTTDQSGRTSMQPVSWDYRFSNLCNFKCRTCGDMLSSSWETEQREYNMIDWTNKKNTWMEPSIRKQISQFQNQQVEMEFAQAVEEHRIEEIYWVGGEPLMFEQHWRYMLRIIELGDAKKVYVRYNTNLSRIVYQNKHLFRDILQNVKDWQICASLDGTGRIGEYIRTGMNYEQWLCNFKEGLEFATNSRQMRIDFTLTLPGLFEVENIVELSKTLKVEILAKVIFSFSPTIVLSPLALPRWLLDKKLDNLISKIPAGAMKNILVQLKQRPTFEEQWPNSYMHGLAEDKQRLLDLEKIRNDKFTLDEILQQDKEIYDWWTKIA